MIWIAYIIGALYCWWWFARIIYNEQQEEGGMTGGDWAVLTFFGGILSGLWPIVFISRTSYVLWKRYVPPGGGAVCVDRLFPKVNEVKTYRDRQAIKLDKRADKLAQREKWVKERELELR